MRKCWIFDVDGTLANIEHRVHYVQVRPKNWPAFWAAWKGDTSYPHVVTLLQELVKGEHPVIIFSARQERERKYTEEQFLNWGVKGYTKMYLRKNGDSRKDTIVKKEMLEQLRQDGFEPIMVFDDRQDVVNMWRENGVPCAQVREYDW